MNPNSIKKNDMILVTRDDGKEYLGKATKVAPWSKNLKITVVNYHFTDENGVEWKGKADARKCRMAPADMIPKAPEAAPVHPTMAKWTLGKTKRGPCMDDGYYYEANILLHGKKVGLIVDEGNGGCTITRFIDHRITINFHNDCMEWAKANCADMEYIEAESDFWQWWDEARPIGKDAFIFFKEKNEEMASWSSNAKPIHSGNTSLVEGKV